MDAPALAEAADEEWLLDETGLPYRPGRDGEREYHHPEPGEDPKYDSWILAKVQQGRREDGGPDTWIDNEDVSRQSAERIVRREALIAAGYDRDPG